MEVSLKDIKPQADRKMFKQQEENRNCTKTTTVAKTEFTLNNDDSALLASLPTGEVKIVSKMLMDNNENSLSVDTLIEILSSNDTNNKLPISDLVPPPALRSPSSASSSSSKAGLSELFASPGPSPKSTSPKKFPSPFHLNGGKPMISDMNKKMKQVAKPRQPRTVYHSQISDNSIGIKLRIKKSNSSQNKASPKKRSRKTKAKGQESDSDDAYVKRRKRSVNNNNNNNNKTFDEPVEQSGWGKAMPKEILFDVSSLT